MQKTKTIVLVTLLALALIPTTIPIIPTASAATAYTEINGTLNGANYTLWIPNPIEAWTRTLVMYCHGYSHTEPTRPLIKASDGTASWAAGMISVGSAFAMSSYGLGGYCIQKGMNATYELTQYLVSTYNVTRVIVMGVSMGGNTALMLGQKYPNVYSAVLDISGSKGLAQQYRDKIDYAATTNDTQLTAKIQAAGGKVPPFPISLTTPPPLSNQLQAFRDFCNVSAADIAAECGGTPDAAPLGYQNIDPIYHANISIPTMTVHGTADALVPYSRSLDYQAAVAAAGKSSLYRLYTVVGGEHADSIVQGVAAAHFSELVAWSIAPVPLLQASAFCNVTVITGWTWWFFAQGTGGVGTLTYQWFEGSTLLQGQTSMVLAATKNTPGTYAYFCKVTDSNGNAANSNAVYLTVR
jgi:pimeloyl-ACP methyl ester carboxylesterase